jgi:hypothetical protein
MIDVFCPDDSGFSHARLYTGKNLYSGAQYLANNPKTWYNDVHHDAAEVYNGLYQSCFAGGLLLER